MQGALAEGIVERTELTVPEQTGTANGALGPDCPSNQCIIIAAEQNQLTLVKADTFEDFNKSENATSGDIIHYTFAVTNEGNVPVNNVKINDSRATFTDQPGKRTTAQTPALASDPLTIRKVANLHAIRRGEQARFTIRLTNNSTANASRIRVVDRAPSGFRFIKDSATVNGKKVTPTVHDRHIIFENLSVPENSDIEIHLRMTALSSAGPGEHINTAFATDISGKMLTAETKAKIEILTGTIFDCADIIGRVFIDDNHDGYQNKGEPGVPGVRLATARGWIITTDKNGRFNIPCAALPDQRIGSNFILKLDSRSLPAGYDLTTENPRVVRLTADKMTEINFGVALGRMVQLVLKSEAFEAGENLLRQKWRRQINQLISVLEQEQAILRLSYVDAKSSLKTAEERLDWVRDFIRQRWHERQGSYPQEIETHVEAGR